MNNKLKFDRYFYEEEITKEISNLRETVYLLKRYKFNNKGKHELVFTRKFVIRNGKRVFNF